MAMGFIYSSMIAEGSIILKTEEERRKWSTVDYNYMTDESASETEDVIRQHKLTWCSEGMVYINHIASCPVSFGNPSSLTVCCLDTVVNVMFVSAVL